MDVGFRDKNIIVSGAANGIGATIFTSLLVEGAHPIGVDLEAFKGSEVEETIQKKGLQKKFSFYQADASDETAVKEIYESIEIVHGLVNNAGILGGDNAHGGRTLKAWHKMLNNHALSAYIMTEGAIPKMEKGAAIVNIGSLELDMAAPEVVLYTAAKGALFGMTVGYTTTLGPQGIRVNMVSPGNVNTPRNIAQYTETKDITAGFENRTPLGRSVEPEEVSDLVLFLLSERASAITGQNYKIDCGYPRALLDPSWSQTDLKDVYSK